MAERADVTINPVQRLIKVAAPSVELTIQDLHDTVEGTQEEIDFLQWPKFIDSAGKQVLDDDTKVGITSTLQKDAKVMFEARNLPAQIGTVTTGDTGGVVLKDTSATFITNEVVPGSVVINYTDESVGTVYRVNSETELELMIPLEGGADNQFDTSDSYRVYNITVCRVSGGNLVGLDDFDNPSTPFQPTFGVAFDRTSSASATQSELEAIQYASFNGGVTVDITSSYSGVAYPVGTPRQPVNNLQDAMLIAAAKGFTVLLIYGNLVIDSGYNYEGMTFIGESMNKSILTITSDSQVESCEFYEASITGILDGNAKIQDCRILDLTYIYGVIQSCMIGPGTIVLGGGANAHFLDCWTGEASADTATIDCGGAGQGLALRNYNGAISIKNKTGPDRIVIDLNSGHVVLESTVSAGPIMLRGVGTKDDQSTGAVVNSSDLLNKETITNAVLRAVVADYTGMEGSLAAITDAAYKMAHNRSRIDEVASQLVVYEDNGVDEWKRFNLKNAAGDPADGDVFERVPI